LIDDDIDDCDIFCEAIKDVSDSECKFINKPAEALNYLKRSKELPTCIFLDLNIPPTTGFNILKALKQDGNLASIPVIMYSTSAAQHEIEKSTELGAHTFIKKSTCYSDLVKSLKSVQHIF
jgi:CheY-like chemotaxis protein